MTAAGRILIWDAAASPAVGAGDAIFTWRGYDEAGDVRSLLRYVDRHAARLRSAYLAWIHDLGAAAWGGCTLVQRLTFSDGLSFWWLSRMAEKSPMKSRIGDAIRLLAVDELVAAAGVTALRLHSADPALAAALAGLAARRGLAFEWTRPGREPSEQPVARPARGIPAPVAGLAYLLRFVATRWRVGRRRSVSAKGSVFFCSYFFNLDPGRAAAGKFVSRYWGQLPALLEQSGVATNWLHRFVPSEVADRIGVAADRLDAFQAAEPGRSHQLLEGGLSAAVLLRVLGRWARLLVASRLPEPEARFTPRGYQVSLWPVFREEWADAMRGREAVDALLSAACFDAVLAQLPRQTVGLYLCEGQGWERGLLHAWRKHGHGRMLAVVHPALRFWDTRYFEDPRVAAQGMPQPDCVVANGETAQALLREAGLAADRIVVAEALRYQYLAAMKPASRPSGTARPVRRVLILGDVMRDATHRLLKMLVEAAIPADGRLEFTLKPHPLCMVEASAYPSLRLSLTSSPLGEILADFDLAYASNGTSAAVDACLAGLPIVVQLDPGTLNLSPLRGCAAATLVGTPAELRAALGETARPVADTGFFCLDPGLPRWRQLLAEFLDRRGGAGQTAVPAGTSI